MRGFCYGIAVLSAIALFRIPTSATIIGPNNGFGNISTSGGITVKATIPTDKLVLQGYSGITITGTAGKKIRIKATVNNLAISPSVNGNTLIGTTGDVTGARLQAVGTNVNYAAASFTNNTSAVQVQIFGTGTNGSNVKLTGNGATTPSKSIRVQGGHLQVTNNAYNATLLDLDDSGLLNVLNGVNTNVIRMANGGVNGVNIKMTGDGGSVPSKFLKVGAGVFQVINDAYTVSLLTLDDLGHFAVSGNVVATDGFGCNGKAAQSSYSVNGNSTDLATAIALVNQLRAALIANGIAQ